MKKLVYLASVFMCISAGVAQAEGVHRFTYDLTMLGKADADGPYMKKQASLGDFTIGMTLSEAQALAKSLKPTKSETRISASAFSGVLGGRNVEASSDNYVGAMFLDFRDEKAGVTRWYTLQFTSPITGSRLYAVKYDQFFTPRIRWQDALDAAIGRWGQPSVSLPSKALHQYSWYVRNDGSPYVDPKACLKMTDHVNSLTTYYTSPHDYRDATFDFDGKQCGGVIYISAQADDAGTVRNVTTFMYDNLLFGKGLFKDRSAMIAAMKEDSKKIVDKAPKPKF